MGDVRAVFDHLQTARRAVVRHALAAERAGFASHEQALTEVLLTRTGPAVRVWALNQPEEGKVGADWLWWWHGDREWFGVLVQAKRHKPRGDKAWYDFDYRIGSGGRQVDALLDSARHLGVAAAYVLYNHPPIPATAIVRPVCCTTRESWRTRLRVSVVPALLARSVIGFEDVVTEHALPIECVTCGRRTRGLAWTARALNISDPVLLRLLQRDHLSTPRSVARTLLAQLAERRSLQLRQAGPEVAAAADAVGLTTSRSDRIFESLPDDPGHFGESYYEHVLRGLRRRAPEYVLAALQGASADEVFGWLGGPIGGLVVVDDAR